MAIKIEIAKPVAKKLKCLFYGPSGAGKTLAALSFPRVLLIDAESGSDLYAGRPGVPEFYRARAKNLSEVNEVLEAVEKDNGKTWDTLIIDPVTVLYDVEKNVGSANNTKDIGFKGWNKVNSRMASLYNRLTGLDVHVVIIAREAIEYSGEGQDLKKIGVKPEADKKLVYMMDFVVHLKTDHSAEVEKSRGVILGKAGVLPKADWSIFAPVASLYVKGETVKEESDETAAAREMDKWENGNVTEWIAKWEALGMTKPSLMEALKISERWGNWKGTVSEADAAVEAYRKPVSLPPGVTASKPFTMGELNDAVDSLYDNDTHKTNSLAKLLADGEIKPDMTLAQAVEVVKAHKVGQAAEAAKAKLNSGKGSRRLGDTPTSVPTDEAELRRAFRARWEGESVTLFKVEKRDYVKAQGRAAGNRWDAWAMVTEVDGSEMKMLVSLYPEDVTAIKAAGHDFPMNDGPVTIPVILRTEADRMRIDNEKIEFKQGPQPFGGKPATDPLFAALPSMSDAMKHMEPAH